MSNIKSRSRRNINLNDFYNEGFPLLPEFTWNSPAYPNADKQYILRMCIKKKELLFPSIPPELEWLEDQINRTIQYESRHFGEKPFIYVTVRHGPVTSVTDDDWHVDGFSMRIPHLPEHNYFCSYSYPTEFVVDPFYIPEDFDPLKHNIHKLFQNSMGDRKVYSMLPGRVYCIDPYIVHRRPKVPEGHVRTFFRITHSAIEIKDDTNTPNPLLPMPKYNNRDIRLDLKEYSY